MDKRAFTSAEVVETVFDGTHEQERVSNPKRMHFIPKCHLEAPSDHGDLLQEICVPMDERSGPGAWRDAVPGDLNNRRWELMRNEQSSNSGLGIHDSGRVLPADDSERCFDWLVEDLGQVAVQAFCNPQRDRQRRDTLSTLDLGQHRHADPTGIGEGLQRHVPIRPAHSYMLPELLFHARIILLVNVEWPVTKRQCPISYYWTKPRDSSFSRPTDIDHSLLTRLIRVMGEWCKSVGKAAQHLRNVMPALTKLGERRVSHRR